MTGVVFQIQTLLPCGAWVKTQSLDPRMVDISEVPHAIKKPRRNGGPLKREKIIEDNALLVLNRWDAARPKCKHRLVKVD